jgi:hypothetical protein
MLSMADEHEIARVIVRYATAVDSRDWPLLRRCFTEDFVGDFGPVGIWHGPDDVVKYMKAGSQDGGASLHRVTNVVADGDGDDATARSYIDALMLPGNPQAEGFHSIAYFDDELLRTAHGWRIRRRALTRVHFAAVPGAA